MSTRTVILAALLATLTAGVVAAATEHTVTQKGKVFSESEVTLKKGETIVFVNDDNVNHNILSTSPDNKFNLGSQAPGVSTPVSFDKAGDVTVICAIHPRMKLAVKVTD